MKTIPCTALLLASLACLPAAMAATAKTDAQIESERAALQAEIDAMPAQVDVLLAKPVDNVVKASKERQTLVFRDKAGCTYDGLLQSSGPKPTDLTVYVSGTYCEATKTSNSLVKYEIPMGPWTSRVTPGTHFTAYRLDKNDQRVSSAPVASSADAARDANRAKFCQAYRARLAAGAKPIPQAEAQCAQDKS